MNAHSRRHAARPVVQTPVQEVRRAPRVGRSTPTAGTLPPGPLIELVAVIQERTGDDLSTVARGIGVTPEWLEALLSGRDRIDASHMAAVCQALHFSPVELWGLQAAAHELPTTQPAGHVDTKRPEPLFRPCEPGGIPELIW